MDNLLFIAFPYVAVILAIGVGIYRHSHRPYTYSSLSSQLLEKRSLFWGSVPFHYGLTLILLAHILPALFPGGAGWLLGDEVRRLILEVTGIAIALYTFFGLILLILRRLMPGSLARAVTSYMDGIILIALLIQIGSGIAVAIFNRWGGVWYLHTAVPWFWSLAGLHPEIRTVALLPPFVKLHFVFGFVVILLFPFSRLVHLVALPIQYLWRPYQVAIWNRLPGKLPAGSKERVP
ncbi:MAG TPA: respiratory nitrate reductase subunit gamma [Terracidiphilus sp.]|nr:respiratory nitrate reductase subunit gamma [Terracidiphilus sp.]